MDCTFSFDTHPATSSWGTKTWARTNEWDMTAEQGFSCVCDEHKHSVDESGRLDDVKQIASWLNCSQDDVAGSRKPSMPKYIRLACPLCLQYPAPSTNPSHLCYRIASPSMIYSTLPTLVQSQKHLISTTEWLSTLENLKCNVMPSGCRNQSSQMLIESRFRLPKSESGPRTLELESANGQLKAWGFGMIRVAWQHNG